MSIVGIDLGTSLAKIVECDEQGNLINKMIVGEKSCKKAFDMFVSSNNIDLKNIEKIIITGVGSSTINEQELYGIKIIKEPEFLCIAKGAMELAEKQEAVIVSMGTGTAFIRVKGDKISHLGGTGVGGGTLMSLCNKFLGTNTFSEIAELVSLGDLSKVDLVIGDITTDEIPGLPFDTTACNFGKLKVEASKEDIALGLVNMIFETIGMMAVFATKNDTIKDIVLIGGLTKVPCIKNVFERFKSITDLNFITPENAEFAVAVGAVKKNI